MTIEEFKEDLNDYMGEGTFTVKEVGNNRIHIIWNINGNDYSQVIESKLLEMKPKDICEEVVRPTVAKLKAFNKQREGVGTGIYAGYGRKEIEEMSKAILKRD